MRRVQVGPGTNTHNAKNDPGKFAPAPSTSGYRRTANASGPQSSKGDYTSTQDIGKQMPSGTGVESGYRRIVHASGPESSKKTTHTLDPGHSQFLAKGGVKGIEEGGESGETVQQEQNEQQQHHNEEQQQEEEQEEVVEEEVVEEVIEEEVVEEEVVEEEKN
eukprot:TRINITY_DN52_c0_g1_i3.p1 TRINITY_DN52_c0_g1~~TRINITY_DN52_c0_g1_i3.p1  ORF type:complete len:162 (+),score=81.66 TRINITY_DN52_c0_g1_i3:438-923(+)